jgi:hypothetical protein
MEVILFFQHYSCSYLKASHIQYYFLEFIIILRNGDTIILKNQNNHENNIAIIAYISNY